MARTMKTASDQDSGLRLLSVFDLLCQLLSGSLYQFEPTRTILSKCVDMLGRSPSAAHFFSHAYAKEALWVLTLWAKSRSAG